MKKLFLYLGLFLFSFTNAQKNENSNQKLYFIENKGQWPEDVLFLTKLGDLDVWITKYGINYTITKMKFPNDFNERFLISKEYDKIHNILENTVIVGHRVLLKFIDINQNIIPQGVNKLSYYHNYFIGNDTSKHKTNVALYNEIIIKNIYEGIDIRYYFDRGHLRYDFIVHPGSNPSKIKFKLSGQFESYLKENSVCFTTRFGEIKMQELLAYQNNNRININFIQQDGMWSFNIGKYDKSKTLIIDPVIYSTFLGGSYMEMSMGIKTDLSGNCIVTGITKSTDYDTIPGVFQSYLAGKEDVFVTKINSNGTGLIYSTYIGGSNYDFVWDIDVDKFGNAYIVGRTQSHNYPTTNGVLKPVITFPTDPLEGFVTKINASGTSLIYSTYLGGAFEDEATGIAVNNNGEAYVTGYTGSHDFSVVSGAYQNFNQGCTDVFICKINNIGSNLIYSTLLGGSGCDYGKDIAIDNNGNAFITGSTDSQNFDITSLAFQNSNNGGIDIFVTKINSSGSGLIYSTYLGGSNNEYPSSICIDKFGNAIITGYTMSNDFDITSNSLQTSYAGGFTDGFVTKLNSNGTNLVYSSYLGGNDFEILSGLSMDFVGNVYVVGHTYSTNFIVTSNAFQPIFNGVCDGFITKINQSGSSAVFSTFWGGSYGDSIDGIVSDSLGNIYVVGTTTSNDFFTTAGSYKPFYTDSGDVFVTKFNICSNSPTITITPSSYTICQGQSCTLNAAGGSIYFWNNNLSNNYSVTVNPTTNSSYSVIGVDSIGCIGTATVSITVYPLPTVNITSSQYTLCSGQTTTLTATGANTYLWSNNSTNDTIIVSPTSTSNYSVIGIDTNGCMNNAQTTITVYPLPIVNANAIPNVICYGDPVYLFTSGTAVNYTWSNSISYPYYPLSTITLTLYGSSSEGCVNSDQITIVVNPLPTVIANASDTIVCQNESVILYGTGTATNYIWYSNYQPILDSTPFYPTITDTYTLTGTDINGCTNTAQITITVNPIFSLFYVNTIDANNSNCDNGMATVYVYGGTPPYSYSWAPSVNSNTNIATNLVGSSGSGNIYTVTVTDANGCSDSQTFTITCVTDVETLNQLNELIIYPNPNNGLFSIDFPSNQNRIITIFDISGKTIFEKSINKSNLSIDISDYENGLYLLEIIENDNKINRYKIIKN